MTSNSRSFEASGARARFAAAFTAMRLLWLMTCVVSGHPGLEGKSSLSLALVLQRGARLLADPQPLHEVEDAGVGAHVLRELVPVPAGQVADELAVLQRRADGPPGPGVQHGRQLPEVSQQQELHVGVQSHAGQVRPERHVQLRDLLHHQPVQLLRAAPAHVPAHPVVGRLRPQAQVLRGAVRL